MGVPAEPAQGGREQGGKGRQPTLHHSWGLLGGLQNVTAPFWAPQLPCEGWAYGTSGFPTVVDGDLGALGVGAGARARGASLTLWSS